VAHVVQEKFPNAAVQLLDSATLIQVLEKVGAPVDGWLKLLQVWRKTIAEVVPTEVAVLLAQPALRPSPIPQ